MLCHSLFKYLESHIVTDALFKVGMATSGPPSCTKNLRGEARVETIRDVVFVLNTYAGKPG